MVLVVKTANLLAEYREANAACRAVRLKMAKFMVDELGIDQTVASKLKAYDFLDGFLIGQGVSTSRHHIDESDE